MAGKKRYTYVTVDGVTYGPDDDMPAEAAKMVTNPKVFEDPNAGSDDADGAEKKSAARSGNKGE